MDQKVEITDEESALAWLDTQDRYTKAWFTVRCALRALPALDKGPQTETAEITLRCCRALMISYCVSQSQKDKPNILEVPAYMSHVRIYSNHLKEAPYNEWPARRSVARSASLAARFIGDWSTDLGVAEVPSRSVICAAEAASYFAGKQAIWLAASNDARKPKSNGPLWLDDNIPDLLADSWAALKEQWAEDDADWSFWIKWYEGILYGTPMPWELTHRIALEVKEDDWEAGQIVVAERIADIRKEFEAKPLDQQALRTHVQKLAKSPVLNADFAQSAALQVEAAIGAFKMQASANELPDGFASFEKLPGAFFAISTTLSVTTSNGPDIESLQAEINQLHGIIAQLRTDLYAAQSRLADSKLSELEAQRHRTFGEKLVTTLTCITMLGTLGGTTAWFFGISPEELRYQALKERLNGLTQQMYEATPSEDSDSLPPSTEV